MSLLHTLIIKAYSRLITICGAWGYHKFLLLLNRNYERFKDTTKIHTPEHLACFVTWVVGHTIRWPLPTSKWYFGCYTFNYFFYSFKTANIYLMNSAKIVRTFGIYTAVFFDYLPKFYSECWQAFSGVVIWFSHPSDLSSTS